MSSALVIFFCSMRFWRRVSGTTVAWVDLGLAGMVVGLAGVIVGLAGVVVGLPGVVVAFFVVESLATFLGVGVLIMDLATLASFSGVFFTSASNSTSTAGCDLRVLSSLFVVLSSIFVAGASSDSGLVRRG